MLCLPPAVPNPGATLVPSSQPRRTRPSRAAGSCFHHDRRWSASLRHMNERAFGAVGFRKRTCRFPPSVSQRRINDDGFRDRREIHQTTDSQAQNDQQPQKRWGPISDEYRDLRGDACGSTPTFERQFVDLESTTYTGKWLGCNGGVSCRPSQSLITPAKGTENCVCPDLAGT